MSLAGWLGRNDHGAPVIETIRNVLLVRQAERLGNLVLLGLAIDALKERLPDIHLTCLVPQKYRLITDMNQSINEVIALDKKLFLRAPWRLPGFIKSLKAMNFDVAIDCSDDISRSATSQFYTMTSGARQTAGYAAVNSRVYDLNITGGNGRHSIEAYLQLFASVFNTDFNFDADRLARNNLNPAAPVIINIGGRGKKRWPLDNFIKLAELLNQQGVNSKFMIGPEELNVRRRLVEAAGHDNIIAPNSLEQLFSAMDNASGFISSDAGPMHLAWSLGLPTLAIFLTSSPEKYRPLGKHTTCIDGRAAPVAADQVAAEFTELRGRCL